jgi:uncharacterized membrane protein
VDVIYDLVKFLHVSSVIVWIGAGVGLVILGIAADRANDRDALARIVGHVIFMAPRVFIPASGSTLLFGVIAAWLQWSFADLWVIVGLIGFAITFSTGNFILKPRAEKVGEIMAREGPSDAALTLGRELLSVAKFDYVMLFIVVADMVFKPSLQDVWLLVVMAIVLIAAAALFLRGAVMPAPARA